METVIGFTGTSKGLSLEQEIGLATILVEARKDCLWMHNGDCVGADASAGKIWNKLGGFIHLHPPINQTARAFLTHEMSEVKKEYLVRNRDIVATCDFMIATPGEMNEQLRSGTWATVRYARKANKDIIFIFPDGEIKLETNGDK